MTDANPVRYHLSVTVEVPRDFDASAQNHLHRTCGLSRAQAFDVHACMLAELATEAIYAWLKEGDGELLTADGKAQHQQMGILKGEHHNGGAVHLTISMQHLPDRTEKRG